MSSGRIVFKGINDGVYIKTDIDNYKEIQEELIKLLDKRPSFYRGAKLLGILSENLEPMEVIELSFMLKYNYGFDVDYEELDRNLQKLQKDKKTSKKLAKRDNKRSFTKFINKTIRSGQAVRHPGNLVIIGDVNSGAFVEAEGNIIVLGSFRGVGHAGKCGDTNAIVASYDLSPTQLRIADKIARSPDKDINSNNRVIPEIAKIVDDKLIIVPYLSK